MLVVLLAAGACKQEQAAHPAAERAAKFLDALKYGDAAGASKLHIESTEAGFYCESAQLSSLLERAKEERSPKNCERVRGLGPEHLEALEPAERGMVQIVRFVCEEPEGGCAGYGARVFESHLAQRLDAPTTAWRGGDWTIQKVVGDESAAVVYVDLRQQGETVANETLTMRRVDKTWYVATSPLDTSPVDKSYGAH